MGNILSKLPKKTQKEMKPLVQPVFYAESYEQGLRRGQELIARFKNNYTSAMECLEGDLEECLTYLKFPEAHWRAIQTSNILERTFGEGRRRTKVIPRFPTESSGVRLLYASLITASRSWDGVKMTLDIWWGLEVLRREAFEEQSLIIEKEVAIA
jgi:transposase-like protein